MSLTLCGVVATHFKDVVCTATVVGSCLGVWAAEVGVGLGVSLRVSSMVAGLIGEAYLAEC